MKRLIDFISSVILLAVLSPALAVIAVSIMLTMGRPVIFRQVRPGLGGRLFTVYKFRTMREFSNTGGDQPSDAERLVPLGRFLRSTSLDELPELFNVLIGDMSLVGPRPLLPEYLELYAPEQARRHEVRPGITGWAQVNGRNALGWERKLDLDVWYVDHHSLVLDLKIAWMSLVAVLKRDGISAEGHATMPRFTGSDG